MSASTHCQHSTTSRSLPRIASVVWLNARSSMPQQRWPGRPSTQARRPATETEAPARADLRPDPVHPPEPVGWRSSAGLACRCRPRLPRSLSGCARTSRDRSRHADRAAGRQVQVGKDPCDRAVPGYRVVVTRQMQVKGVLESNDRLGDLVRSAAQLERVRGGARAENALIQLDLALPEPGQQRGVNWVARSRRMQLVDHLPGGGLSLGGNAAAYRDAQLRRWVADLLGRPHPVPVEDLERTLVYLGEQVLDLRVVVQHRADRDPCLVGDVLQAQAS